MAIKYEPTLWENGKTVIRASHLEKIERGIIDVINTNDEIYKDEDNRKANEVTREVNEVERISNESNRNKVVSDKLDEIDKRVDNAISSGTHDLEIKDARVGIDGTKHDTLKRRLDAIETQPIIIFETIEG